MTEPELKRYMQKIYQFLEEGHTIEFKRLRDAHGMIWKFEYPTTVILDPRKELFPTIIHEALHYIHPDLSETNILKLEREIMSCISERRIKNLIKRFAAIL